MDWVEAECDSVLTVLYPEQNRQSDKFVSK